MTGVGEWQERNLDQENPQHTIVGFQAGKQKTAADCAQRL